MLRIWQMHKGELHGAVAELRLVGTSFEPYMLLLY